jgi:hypothetical protein
LALVDARQVRFLTPPVDRYLSASCGPAGNFIAAIRRESSDRTRLVLLDGGGRFLRTLGEGGYADEAPRWGPGGAGVVFVRQPLGPGAARVWFIPEGGLPRPTGLKVATGSQDGNWFSVFDWSAGPPTGMPASR